MFGCSDLCQCVFQAHVYDESRACRDGVFVSVVRVRSSILDLSLFCVGFLHPAYVYSRHKAGVRGTGLGLGNECDGGIR